MTDDDIIKLALDKWGPKLQLLKTAEECNELAKELIKNFLKPEEASEEKILNEVGDVMLTLNYIIEIFGEEKVQEATDRSFEVLLNRLEEANQAKKETEEKYSEYYGQDF